jgi:hypothetical protein
MKTATANSPTKLGHHDSKIDLHSRRVSPTESGNNRGLNHTPSQTSINSASFLLRPNNKIERQIEAVHANQSYQVHYD